MTRPERLPQVAKVMSDYNIEILGLSEVRWNGFGEFNTDYGTTLLYSGNEDEDAIKRNGVAFLLTRKAKTSLLNWKPVSDRIIMARFTSHARNITIVQCYAPTNSASEDTKSQFYDVLQSTLHCIKKQDLVVLMGDLNAKMGTIIKDREHYMGAQGADGLINENGEYFGNLCSSNGLVIGGTLFKHKSCHKETWVSPDGITRNQIDHIAISKHWRSSLMDVRNKRGADVDSDHHLVVADIRLKIATPQKNWNKTAKKFNIDKLKDPECKKAFSISLRNRFQLLEKQNNGELDDAWSNVRTAFVKSGEEVLGFTRLTRKSWMSTELWQIIEKRQTIKTQLVSLGDDTDAYERKQTEYRAMRRKIKLLARRDKRQEADDLAKRANAAAKRKDMREIFEATKTLSGKRKKPNINKPLRAKNGNFLGTKEKQIQRWHEHFSELLERSLSDVSATDLTSFPGALLDISTTPPTINEIVKVINNLKSGKSPGIDNINIEMLKADSVQTAHVLHSLLLRIWETEKVPLQWKEGLLVKIPKKGDLSFCDNWRGITLLPVAVKVLTKLLLNRMSPHIEKTLLPEQAGFRPGRSCIDQINTMRILIEQCVEWQMEIYLAFVDFQKAFDTVKWSSIWSALEKRGVPTKIVNLIKALYEGSTCRVVHEQALSSPINITSGVKQGCLLSPLLFILLLDDVLRDLKIRIPGGIAWGEDNLEFLAYADDIVLISPTHRLLKTKLEALRKTSLQLGLHINAQKTVVMNVYTNNSEALRLDHRALNTVNSFTYLGSTLTNKGGSEEDIAARIRKAHGVFAQLSRVWRSNVLTQRIKLSIFESCVKSVLLYGCESWKVTKFLTQKLQVFVNKSLRNILRIYWPETITNENLWLKCNQIPIKEEIAYRKWRWIGHSLRREGPNPTAAAFEWQPSGKRRPGRPNITWRRSVNDELKLQGLFWKDVKEKAQNRDEWRCLSRALSIPRI